MLASYRRWASCIKKNSSFRRSVNRVFSNQASSARSNDLKTHSKKSSEDVRKDESWDDEVLTQKTNPNDKKRFPEYGNKPPGPEPTRFGDWQYKGRSTDF